MNLNKELHKRSGSKCELCSAEEDLNNYYIEPNCKKDLNDTILVCGVCSEQMEIPNTINPNHWRCLNDSMWSEVDAVKVIAWRMLNRLKLEGWSQDLLDMMYMDEHVRKWAEATGEGKDDDDKLMHKDCNGTTLSHGDSVTVMKDLNVKGSSLVAKRGTAVRNISLVHDDSGQIEGKVGGQQVVLLTKFVKKN